MKIDILKYIPVNGISAVVSVLTIVIFTRLFSAEDFGLYALTIISAGFFHMAAFSWLEAATARFHARADNENNLDDFYRTLYGAAIPIVIITILITGLCLSFFLQSSRLAPLLALAFLNTALLCLYQIRLEAYQASQRIRAYSLNKSLISVMTLLASVGLFFATNLGVLSPFAGALVVTLIFLGFQASFFISVFKRGKFQMAWLKHYLAYGVPLAISLLLSYLLEVGDLYYIDYFLDKAAVGSYNAGYSLASRPIDLIVTWCAMALMPIAVITYEKAKSKDTQLFLQNFLSTLMALSLPATLGVCLVSKDLSFVLGENVRVEAETVMPIIAISALLAGLFVYYFQQIYALIERTKLFAALILCPVIINLVANFILIPKHGITGAALGTLIAYGSALIVSYWFLRPFNIISMPWQDIGMCFIASLIMGIVVWCLPLGKLDPGALTLIIKAITGGAVYVTLAFLFNILNFRAYIKDRVNN